MRSVSSARSDASQAARRCSGRPSRRPALLAVAGQAALGGDDDVVAPALEGLGDQALAVADVAIVARVGVGGVDEADAGVERGVDGADRAAPRRDARRATWASRPGRSDGRRLRRGSGSGASWKPSSETSGIVARAIARSGAQASSTTCAAWRRPWRARSGCGCGAPSSGRRGVRISPCLFRHGLYAMKSCIPAPQYEQSQMISSTPIRRASACCVPTCRAPGRARSAAAPRGGRGFATSRCQSTARPSACSDASCGPHLAAVGAPEHAVGVALQPADERRHARLGLRRECVAGSPRRRGEVSAGRTRRAGDAGEPGRATRPRGIDRPAIGRRPADP